MPSEIVDPDVDAVVVDAVGVVKVALVAVDVGVEGLIAGSWFKVCERFGVVG